MRVQKYTSPPSSSLWTHGGGGSSDFQRSGLRLSLLASITLWKRQKMTLQALTLIPFCPATRCEQNTSLLLCRTKGSKSSERLIYVA